MIKFTRSTKKKLDKVRQSGSGSNQVPPDRSGHSSRGGGGRGGVDTNNKHLPHHHHRGQTGDRSVSSAYSAHSQYSARSDYTDGTSGQYAGYPNLPGGGGGTAGDGGGGNNAGVAGGNNHRTGRSAHGRRHQRGGANAGGASAASSTGGSRRYSSAQSVASISSASVFAPSVVSGAASTGGGGLQPSSARLLRDLNASARSSLLSSLGTAASRTFRSYKMSLPRCPPPIKSWNGNSSGASMHSGSGDGEDGSSPPVETDLELLGRTVHAVSSALTEPPKEGDKYMIYDVSFNPKGCVWDALIVVQVKDDDNADGDGTTEEQQHSRSPSQNRRGGKGGGAGGSSSSRMRSRSRSKSRNGSSRSIGTGDAGAGGRNKTFTFPIRVTCAEDDDVEDLPPAPRGGGALAVPSQPRAKTYAVDLSVIDDSIHHPISRWSNAEAADHRDDIKNAMEWVSYGVRRSMARSMFPTFPEGCQGKPFREIYQLNKKLKSGTFSTVCRGVHRATGRQVAVKCILRKKIEPSVDAAVFEEVLIMSGLHHKYICPMIDYFEEDRCHFVVMELEKGGDLCERLNDKVTYSEQDARTVVRNICEAMEFVHSKGFAHCDIKPRNYLLRGKRDDVDVRLADFGFAQHVHAPNSLTSQCGTPFFVAPEVINRKPYDQKVDMWSIGVTCYLLLGGDTPFNGKNRQQLFRRISCDEPTFSDDKWGHVSDEAVEFVRLLLTKDPSKRLSAAGALSHKWLMENNNTSMGHNVQPSGGESSEEVMDIKRRAAKSPRRAAVMASVTGHHSNDMSSPRTATSRERPRGDRSKKNRSVSRDGIKNRSVSRDRTKNRTASRSTSRDRTNPNRSISNAPPPPPKPQALPREAVANEHMNRSGGASAENARLLDVIKNQDAKIEKLERMVKRMLEPEGAVHEC
mmetsp:Transcript_9494/g.17058  ORF Transcript_9494/g.17058 Transcript_9494/m.17058 type:complete len:914 (+) Transcript_9494:218-2959(+)